MKAAIKQLQVQFSNLDFQRQSLINEREAAQKELCEITEALEEVEADLADYRQALDKLAGGWDEDAMA